MANHTSTKKSIRKNEKRRLSNRRRVSRLRTLLSRVDKAILEGKKEDAQKAFKDVQPELARSVNKGVFKLNTVSRKLSRLSKKIKLIA